MINSGTYKVYFNGDKRAYVGTFEVKEGRVSIISDPDESLTGMILQGNLEGKVSHRLTMIARNPYYLIKKVK